MPAKVGAFLHLSPRISPRHGRWCSKPDRPLSRRGAGGPLTYWPSAHADDTDAAVLEDETITNPQHSRAESRLCLEPGGAVPCLHRLKKAVKAMSRRRNACDYRIADARRR
jgi:hypothetical protein